MKVSRQYHSIAGIYETLTFYQHGVECPVSLPRPNTAAEIGGTGYSLTLSRVIYHRSLARVQPLWASRTRRYAREIQLMGKRVDSLPQKIPAFPKYVKVFGMLLVGYR